MKKRDKAPSPEVVMDTQEPNEALYSEYVSAKVETTKLQKKIEREEHLVDHLGYSPEKLESLWAKYEKSRSLQVDCFSRLRELKMA